jgi:hypothetical protein
MIDFPNNPIIGDLFSSGTRTWEWTGTRWDSFTVAAIPDVGGNSGKLLTTDGSSVSWSNTNYAPAESISGYVSHVSGFHYRQQQSVTTVTTPVVGRTHFSSIYIPNKGFYNQITVSTGATLTGSGIVRVGIFSGVTGKPGQLILDAGTANISAPSTAYAITINQELNVGTHWLAWNVQTAPTTYSMSCSTGLGSSVYNPFGTPHATSSATGTGLAGYTESSVFGPFENVIESNLVGSSQGASVFIRRA